MAKAFPAKASSREGEIIDLGVEHGIIDKAGSWYSYGSDRIGQGKENVREYLKANSEVANEIEASIRAKLLPETIAEPAAAEGEEEEAVAKQA
jgi:recombination protein RecA